MNKKAAIISLAVLVAIAGGTAYLLSAKTDTSTDSGTKKVDQEGTNENTQITAEAGAYIDYDADVIASTSGTKILFFHAAWCPQCRALEADIKAKGVPEGVTFIKVDYDSNQLLRQEYGVTLQTTLVRVDDNGELVEKFVAYDEPTLAAVSQQLL